jgi:hypothetical protein
MRLRDGAGRGAARQKIDVVQRRLGERGTVWGIDGAPAWNRHMPVNLPYADWFIRLSI